jgi:membrane associated rhomboid family serine protease
MLSDRSYMRDSYGRTGTSILTWMISALIAGFFLHLIFDRWLVSKTVADFAQFSGGALENWRLWTLLTHTLIHDGPLHILFTALAIYFSGRELLPLLGERRLTWLFIGAATCGALLWYSIHHDRNADVLIGATSVAAAFFTLFACFYPDREIAFLFFFVPVTIKPKYAALALAAIDLAGLIFNEIPGGRFSAYVAHSAHVGGMLAGLFYFRFVHQREWQTPDGRAEIELPKWLRKTQKVATEDPVKFKLDLTNRQDLRAEVDRILDKINSDGFSSLTLEEKRVLDEAKDMISRR